VILDSSAVIAIILREPGHEGMLDAVCDSREVGIAAPTLVEATIVLSSSIGKDGRGLLARFLAEAGVLTIPFSEPHWSSAVDAWLRFGKGRHKAALNFGDCLAHAVARVAGRPLLCVGDDFARTDLEVRRA
jgi:ribonuclease VapC